MRDPLLDYSTNEMVALDFLRELTISNADFAKCVKSFAIQTELLHCACFIPRTYDRMSPKHFATF